MVPPGKTVTVALSGGADSVALLKILTGDGSRCVFSSPSLKVQAVHVHHGLRGADADADEAFARELCEELGVPLDVRHVDVAAYAKDRGMGIEEAGRAARRAIYAEYPVVALAHHENDQAETFLFRAARGTSFSGLACMRPVERLHEADRNSTCLIRPLLCATREEIEDWLRSRGQAWREDVTNRDEAYARNAIRHSALPALAEKVNTEAVRHIAAVAESVAGADAFLRAEAERRADGIVRRAPSLEGDEPGEEIQVFDELRELPDVLQGYVLLGAMERAAGTRSDIGRLHVEQLRALFDLPAGKRIELPHGIVAVRERGFVRM